MNARVEIGHYYFKVFIDNSLHVCIDQKEFVGISSWYDCETMCVIEYITKTNCIRTEFDSVDKWKAVLNELNNNL